jgi:RNA polymerase sigma-70 factor (ECF subfamily)
MNREEFAGAVQQHKDAVYGLALYLLVNTEDAEDVTQDVFLALWRSRERVPLSAHRPWLLRVCRNACHDVRRRRRVRGGRSRSETPSVLRRPWEPPSAEPGEIPDLGAGARRVEGRMELLDVFVAMDGLGESQRAALYLREVEDMTYDEIAGVLGMTLSNVKVTLHRARRRLREALASADASAHE